MSRVAGTWCCSNNSSSAVAVVRLGKATTRWRSKSLRAARLAASAATAVSCEDAAADGPIIRGRRRSQRVLILKVRLFVTN